MNKTIGSIPVKSRVPLAAWAFAWAPDAAIDITFAGESCCRRSGSRSLGVGIKGRDDHSKGGSARYFELVEFSIERSMRALASAGALFCYSADGHL